MPKIKPKLRLVAPIALAARVDRPGKFRPIDILALMDAQPGSLLPTSSIATDTETSGLFADDGARTSTASIAWVDHSGDWAQYADRITYNVEQIAPGLEVAICSAAWPFDQSSGPRCSNCSSATGPG